MPKVPIEALGVDFKALSAKLKEQRIAAKKLELDRTEFRVGVVKARTWTEHKANWSDCILCDLCSKRSKVVLAKGKIPCDILMVGEAPGAAEDVLGQPFVGNAGLLLSDIVEDAIAESKLVPKKIRIAYTNLIGCIPIDTTAATKIKTHEPPTDSIQACKQRLQELVSIAKPKAIVMVGKFSQKWCPKLIDWDFEYSIDIIHPAALLRLDNSQSPLAIQRVTISIRDLLLQVYGEE